MKKKITIIDYGAGNILSLKRALEYLSFNTEVISDPRSINNANYLILPGDGAFGYAVKKLKNKKIYEPIINHISQHKPFLGICIGMQLLMTESSEFGNHKGLNIIQGKITKIKKSKNIKIPSIGWSEILINNKHNKLESINFKEFNKKKFYFVHSFKADVKNNEDLIGYYFHGKNKISAIIGKENVIGAQFHPEKSGKFGLNLLKKFIKI